MIFILKWFWKKREFILNKKLKENSHFFKLKIEIKALKKTYRNKTYIEIKTLKTAYVFYIF